MITTEQFCLELRGQGVQLVLDGERLRCTAPKGVLTPGLQSELAQRKSEILEFLKASRGSACQSGVPLLRRVSREGPLPLSFGQQRLWFLQQMDPDSPVYNLPMLVLFCRGVGDGVIRRCLNEVIRRHEILRTRFVVVDGQPQQVIAPDLELELPSIALNKDEHGDIIQPIRRLVLAEQAKPFDLAHGPIVRAKILQVCGEPSLLLLVVHHIATDGWSIDLLRREFKILSEAFCRNEPSPLRALPIQYADYAHWEREWFQGETLNRELAFWRTQLAGSPALLQLPTDRPRPAEQTFNGAMKAFSISPKLTEGIRALAHAESATIFMAILAVFKVWIYRYSGQEDVVVGTSIAHRGHVELEELVGFFVNSQALRTRLSGELSVREVLRRVRRVAVEALDHPDLPFEKLVEELQPQRNLSYSPIFQVMLTVQNAEAEAGSTNPVGEAVFLEAINAKFDLDLFAFDTGRALHCKLEYNTDLFDAATIDRMIGQFQCLLEGFVSRPDKCISSLPLLSDAERRQVIVEWNQTAVEYERQCCFHEVVEQQAARVPDAVAVVFEDQRITYRELNQQANQLAHHLRNLGVRPEVRVGIFAERSPELLVGLLGVLKAGGAYVPLDPAYPAERLDFMISDSEIAVLLTQERLLPKLPKVRGRTVCLDLQRGDWAQADTADITSGATVQNLAYVIFTSGSTGRPKGIMITHGGLMNYLTWCAVAYSVDQGSGALVHSSISFDLTITGLFAPLLVGNTVHLLPEANDLQALSSALRKKSHLTLVKLTPAHLELMSQQVPAESAGSRTRAFVIGGDQLPVESLQFWQANAPATMLINEYGPAETVVGCCIHVAKPGDATAGFVSIGRPIANTQMYILDRCLEPVPIGVPGELCIAGSGLARGYLRRPEVTAEKFVPHPFSNVSGERMYRSGDIARFRPDGTIDCLGRMDHQVKIRGFRIEPGEIETTLIRHPAIQEAVVVVENVTPAERRLVAFLVPRRSPHPSVTELRSFLQRDLPEYMIPAAFVYLDALPLTQNGKIDRPRLPMPTGVRSDLEVEYVQPQTDAEQAIASVWQEVLNVQQVGVHDNFFELGGHSLLLVKVHARLRDELGLEISLIDMFRYPTVKALARKLGQTDKQLSFETIELRAQQQKQAIDRKRQINVEKAGVL